MYKILYHPPRIIKAAKRQSGNVHVPVVVNKDVM